MIRITLTAILASLTLAALPARAQDEDGPASPAGRAPVEQVSVRSLAEGKPMLTGYLFKPSAAAGKAPAVVLMHTKDGAYSSRSGGDYRATTLTPRFKFWGQYWASRGYYVLLVDSYGARGFPQGFGDTPVRDRPASVDDVDVRPLDAYGALQYLRALPEVDGDRVGLMGFSNGGGAALATMADDKPGDMRKLGFRAAVALYPGCVLKKRFDKKGYTPYAPVRVFMGGADKGASPTACKALVDRSRKAGGDIELTLYDSVGHGFDEPGRKTQSVELNAKATADVRNRAALFFERALASR
ncbi:MAG: dienelactone hydrolase family protein [Caulobacter sp.]|nr:dienelactone hydrolase family protein [Caulobacter sp.]